MSESAADQGRVLLKEWKGQHVLHTHSVDDCWGCTYDGGCEYCNEPVPCPMSRLIAAVEGALAGLDKLADEACYSRYGSGCDGKCRYVAEGTADNTLAKLVHP